MIAEINSKISKSGSNLSDRLEDKLTGDVFGHLRYLPFHIGLKPILQACSFNEELQKKLFLQELEKEQNFEYKFWPYHKEGEPDLILESDNAIVLIEVKYKSRLSSDDDIEDSTLSNNQLSRESEILKRIKGNKKPFLIFLAEKSDAATIYNQTLAKNQINKAVSFGYISWTTVLEELLIIKNEQQLAFPNNLIINDTIALLQRKGFEKFKNFNVNVENVRNEHFHFARQRKGQFSFETNLTINTNYYEFR